LDELQGYYDDIKTYDAVILAVSVTSPETNKNIKDKFGLEYPMLCDVEHQVVNKYGVIDEEDDVRPSIFIIDKKGIVTWRYIGTSSTDTIHSSIIVEKLQDIN